jgi:hypothetical protein
MLFALLAATAAQPQARATVRILPAARITRDEWKSAARRREIVIVDGGRKVTVRLVEFE